MLKKITSVLLMCVFVQTDHVGGERVLVFIRRAHHVNRRGGAFGLRVIQERSEDVQPKCFQHVQGELDARVCEGNKLSFFFT